MCGMYQSRISYRFYLCFTFIWTFFMFHSINFSANVIIILTHSYINCAFVLMFVVHLNASRVKHQVSIERYSTTYFLSKDESQNEFQLVSRYVFYIIWWICLCFYVFLPLIYFYVLFASAFNILFGYSLYVINIFILFLSFTLSIGLWLQFELRWFVLHSLLRLRRWISYRRYCWMMCVNRFRSDSDWFQANHWICDWRCCCYCWCGCFQFVWSVGFSSIASVFAGQSMSPGRIAGNAVQK